MPEQYYCKKCNRIFADFVAQNEIFEAFEDQLAGNELVYS